MIRVEYIFSLVRTQAPKATTYIIQTMERPLLVEMSSLMKKKHRIGVLKMEIMILFPSKKKKKSK